MGVLKSLRPQREEPSDRTPPEDPGNQNVDFHGEGRQNPTHQSTTDPEARLAKKNAGKEARLCYTESMLMENRNGIIIDLRIGRALETRLEVDKPLSTESRARNRLRNSTPHRARHPSRRSCIARARASHTYNTVFSQYR
jgi:hypothetical protein